MLYLFAMSYFRWLPFLLLLGALTACDNKPEPTPRAPAPLPAQPTEPLGKDTTATPVPEPVIRLKPIKDPNPQLPLVVLPKPELLPALKLDLRLSPELVDQLQPEVSLEVEPEKPALLPELFVEKLKKSSPFELNGRLITNDYGDKTEDYWYSIEGAELQFKFRN